MKSSDSDNSPTSSSAADGTSTKKTSKLKSILHRDVTQCLASSLAVCYYSRSVNPTTAVLPLPRSHCRLPSNICYSCYDDENENENDDDTGNTHHRHHHHPPRPPPPARVELVALEVYELTYAVEVDHTHAIIRVAFRGSLTQLDWWHDFIFRMVSVRNPLVLSAAAAASSLPSPNHDQHHPHHVIRQTSHFGVHLGFRNYLFGGILPTKDPAAVVSSSSSPSSSLVMVCFAPSKKVTNDGTSCKYERILGHVRRQLERYPTYQVQVCGHSMGGAIATLTAFCLAADGIRPVVPITCVSIASPRIGNGNFVRAVAELEVHNRLRHLRIVNSDDIVTALPDTTMLAFGLAAHWIRQNFYLHVGMCLHMSKKEDQDDDDDKKKVDNNNNNNSNNSAAAAAATSADFFFPKLHPHHHALYDWTHRTKNMAKRVLTLYHLASTNIPQTHHPLEYEARLNRRSVEQLLRSHNWEDLYGKYLGHLQQH